MQVACKRALALLLCLVLFHTVVAFLCALCPGTHPDHTTLCLACSRWWT